MFLVSIFTCTCISSCFLSFQFVLSVSDNVNFYPQVCALFWVLFLILHDFIQAKALNLGIPLMIVHPAPRCRHHCFYLRCCQVFLIFKQDSSFDPPGSCQLPIARSDTVFSMMAIMLTFFSMSGFNLRIKRKIVMRC